MTTASLRPVRLLTLPAISRIISNQPVNVTPTRWIMTPLTATHRRGPQNANNESAKVSVSAVARKAISRQTVQTLKSRGFKLLNEKRTKTWGRGPFESTINLGFISTRVAYKISLYRSEPSWTTIADHYPIHIQLNESIPPRSQGKRFKIKNAPWDEINKEVEKSPWYHDNPDISIPRLTETIQRALANHCKRIRPSDWSRPEWSPETARLLQLT
ncbi:hypothetical protein K402DRAFT_212163 [Aulographum hederae CBS 113979]|uniref:Endonuclease/exonuclease/phosphatase domain-containing protein n=1 Tax=Aulographum hederae CBS 113979 TaxID=1176131 RepID=A0A6G1GMI6_9PEZI|nr:hypothetical protein K402DRAFT_212163 [Aulographum hederae CBS 113979]